MILTHFSSSLPTLFFILTTALAFALPNPTLLSLPSPLNTTILAPPKPDPPPSPPPIHCLTKPHLPPINEFTCAGALHHLVDGPEAETPKFYRDVVTSFGQAPCAIELRKGGGGIKGGIWISDRVIAGAAVTVLKECGSKMGAGWAVLHDWGSWYVLVYGDME